MIEPTKPSRKRLIGELLGAILVITIIALILFPVFTNKNPGHRRACISNLKQLTLGAIMYLSDNNESLPPYYTFDGPGATQKLIDVTMVYTKNKGVYLCPQDNDSIQLNQEGLEGKMTYVDSLTLRGIIPEFSTGKRVLRQSDVKDVAMTPFLRDPIRGYGLAEPKSKEQKPQFMSPHGTRFILSYLDGHAKAKSPIDEFKEL